MRNILLGSPWSSLFICPLFCPFPVLLEAPVEDGGEFGLVVRVVDGLGGEDEVVLLARGHQHLGQQRGPVAGEEAVAALQRKRRINDC